MLVKDVLKEFLFECEIRKLTSKTVKSYRNNIDAFLVYCEKENAIIELEDINQLHIKEYFNFLTKNRRKESYVNGILKTLRAFYKYCLKEEYINKNPCLKVSWQKEGITLIETFTDEEVKKLLNVYEFSDYLNARNKTLIAFLIDTGARNNETCGMKVSDIKEDHIIIHGKGRKDRYIGISPMLKKYMIKYERIKDSFFYDKNIRFDNYFLSQTGKPLTDEAIQNVVRKIKDTAGVRTEIRCSPHTFRHYFAQTQLKNGLDVYSPDSTIIEYTNYMNKWFKSKHWYFDNSKMSFEETN